MDPTLLDIVLLVGFAARLTRLAVVDDIAEGPRILAVRYAGRVGDRPMRWTLSLLSCPYCIGFWLSVAVIGSWAAWGDTAVWLLIAAAFTLSYVVGHLVALLDVHPED